MTKEILVHHVAVECCSQHHADRFFSTVLGLQKIKSTLLSKELSVAIFKIEKEVQFDFYDNGKTRFEVFITDGHREPSFAHTCIEVENKSDFISRCKEHGLDPFFVEKNGKQLLFVRDFSGNLFEVLETIPLK
jgi:catechol 2,3-dioxygenase-like lactoylglutathione lyase family enzyme